MHLCVRRRGRAQRPPRPVPLGARRLSVRVRCRAAPAGSQGACGVLPARTAARAAARGAAARLGPLPALRRAAHKLRASGPPARMPACSRHVRALRHHRRARAARAASRHVCPRHERPVRPRLRCHLPARRGGRARGEMPHAAADALPGRLRHAGAPQGPAHPRGGRVPGVAAALRHLRRAQGARRVVGARGRVPAARALARVVARVRRTVPGMRRVAPLQHSAEEARGVRLPRAVCALRQPRCAHRRRGLLRVCRHGPAPLDAGAPLGVPVRAGHVRTLRAEDPPPCARRAPQGARAGALPAGVRRGVRASRGQAVAGAAAHRSPEQVPAAEAEAEGGQAAATANEEAGQQRRW